MTTIYYLGARFSKETNRALHAYRASIGLGEAKMPGLGFHTTIIYSRTPFTARICPLPTEPGVIKGVSLFGTSLVLTYLSSYIKFLFDECRLSGGTSDYEDIRPHITIAEEITAIDLREISIPDIKLLVSEIFYREYR